MMEARSDGVRRRASLVRSALRVAVAMALVSSLLVPVAAVAQDADVDTGEETGGDDRVADGPVSGPGPLTVAEVPPTIEIDPDRLVSTQEPGAETTQTLDITNVGAGELEWDLSATDDAVGEVVFDNGPFITHPGAGPDGSDRSTLQSASLGMNGTGFNVNAEHDFRIAESFTVPDDEQWEVEAFTFYGYSTLSSTTSAFTEVNYQIWDGPPGEEGSEVIFGDEDTNRLHSTSWTGVYRVTETAADTQRPVMDIIADGGVTLDEGTYWVDWQLASSGSAWAVPITILGESTTGNALHFTEGDAGVDVWQDLEDSGTNTPQGLPFLVHVEDDTSIDFPSWLDVDPISGTLGADETDEVNVTFDATDLDPGIYQAIMAATSNDPETPAVNVPVTLTVHVPEEVGDFVEVWFASEDDVTTNWTQRTLDLSTWASETVCVAFAYRANNGHSWFVDDVAVTSGGDAVLDEDFTDDAFPPAGWEVFQLDDLTNRFWDRSTTNPNSDPAAAFQDWAFSDQVLDNWLVTAPVELGDDAELTWFERYGFVNYYDYSGVFISTGSCELEEPERFPEVGVDPAALDVEVLEGEADEVELTISNTGEIELNWEVGIGGVATDAASEGPASDDDVERGTAGSTASVEALRASARHEPLIQDASFEDGSPNDDTEVDLSLGEGNRDPRRVPDCGAPLDGDWLSVAPDSGTTAAGDSSSVTVTADTSGLAPGDHQAVVCVESDDPENPVVEVPVSLTVVQAPAVIDVEPTELNPTAEEGESTTETLDIVNLGSADLEWEIGTAEPVPANEALIRPTGPMATHETAELNEFVSEDLATDSTGEAGEAVAPERRTARQDTITITHSQSQNIVAPNTRACPTPPTAFLRTFTLEDFDIDDGFAVTQVEFGIEALHSEAAIDVNLYELESDDDFTYANMGDPIGSATESFQPQSLTMVSVPVSGDVSPGATLVVEVTAPAAPGGAFFIGSNSAGETALSYIAAAACGAPEPTPFGAIAPASVHVVMNVTGEVGDPVGCAAPVDIPWISGDPGSGVTVAGETTTVEMTFDADGVEPGIHESLVCVNSNDPDNPRATVPVIFTVEESDDPDPVVESVVVVPEDASVEVDGTQQFTATAVYEGEVDDQDVTDEADWVSDNSAVATVDGEGLATGVGAGDAAITATFEGESGAATLTVADRPVDPDPELVEVSVTPPVTSIPVGGTEQLSAIASFDNHSTVDVTGEAEWTSSGGGVATVEAGLVSGVTAGTVTITATSDGESGSAMITVTDEGDDPEPPDPGEPLPEGVVRVSGSNRFETAITISQATFGDGEAGSVVLARADDFADSLAGTPLAVDRDAPVLLTVTDTLIDVVADEIGRVLPAGGTVYLLGGTAALDASVEADLVALGYTPVRLAGPERIGTSLAVANELAGDPGDILITNGFNFPDALAAGAAGAEVDGVVVLTTPDAADPQVDAFLTDNPTARVTAVGGPAARAYPDATPVFGPTRETTAVAVAEAFFDTPVAIAVARQDDFADALAGGAHIGRLGGPLLLTPDVVLHPDTEAYLCANADSITTGFVYGGTAAVSADVSDLIGDAIDGLACP